MISLKDIKIAIFDFDDTLAIHRDSNYVENRKACCTGEQQVKIEITAERILAHD